MKKSSIVFVFIVLFVALGRLLIVLPGATPLVAMGMFAGYRYKLKFSFILGIVSLFASDLALSLLNGYPVFGSWSLFTYSGIVLICAFSFLLHKYDLKILMILNPLMTLFFWAWTNLDSYFFTALYSHTASGFVQCYIMALPFLKNALWGNFLWMLVLFFPLIVFNRRSIFIKNEL